jgi:predicted ATPase
MEPRPRNLGPYRIVGRLGQGGMGVVYRGEDPRSGQPVAVKTVRLPAQGLLASIRREIQALARIRHPGIVRILAEGVQDGLPWYAMELLDGMTLRGLCAELFGTRKTSGASGRGWWTLRLEREAQRTVPASPRHGPVLAAPQDATLLRASAGPAPADAAAGTWSGRDRPADRTPATQPVPEPAEREASSPAPAASSPRPSSPRRLAARGRLQEMLTLVRRLCAPVAFLHGEGIVHRDLKPENVFVRSDGLPVLVDFGLISLFGGKQISREELDASLVHGGTVAYMAPEQALGELVDGRADLYALGCMLYELLTGRPPFRGKAPHQVVWKHFYAEPQPLSELVEGVPPRLEELVLGLLAKRPQERLGHADVVAAALAELGAEDGLAGAAPPPRPVLYRPSFTGREQELGQCAEHLERLQRGEGGLVLVGGESGVGKTRLAMELARRARREGVQVLTGECLWGVGSQEPEVGSGDKLDADLVPLPSPVSGLPSRPGSARAPRGRSDRSPSLAAAGGPLQALRRPLQALADRCRERGAEETQRLLGHRAAALALYEPALQGLPGQEALARPAALPPDAARLRLFWYLALTFEALASDAPLLLVLDDLQWADELTLGFLAYLLRSGRLQRTKLLVAGTYRTEEAGGIEAAPLQALLDISSVRRLQLERLGTEAVRSMVGGMLALRPAPELLVRFLAQHSEGNPFFVAEYLRAALDEGLLWRDAKGRWQVAEPTEREATEADYETLPLPHLLQELVGRRLGTLGAVARQLAEVAAVLGREADAALLAAVAGLGEAAASEPIRDLLVRQVLEESGAGRLRFVHDKLREVAYKALGGGTRRQLHRAVAQVLEARLAKAGDEPLVELGHHWERAGEPAKARERYLSGARRASNGYAHVEAERLYRAFLRLVSEPTEESVAARNELAESVLSVRAQNREALAEHRLALEEARTLRHKPLQIRSLRGLGRARWALGHVHEACALLAQALQLSREIGDLLTAGRVLSNFGLLRMEQGRLDQAQALLSEALHIQREVGDPPSEVRALANLGRLHWDQGRLEEAEALLSEALDLARGLGDREAEGLCLGNLGGQHYTRGRLEESLAFYRQALTVARDIGDRRGEGLALGNLAIVVRDLGRTEEAWTLFEQALELHRESDRRRSEGWTLSNLAGLERLRGSDPLEAERRSREAESILREVGDSLGVALSLCECGHAALALGRSGRERFEEAEQIAASIHALPESGLGRAIACLRRAVGAFEAGEPDRLFRGVLIEDLPEGLRRWLTETGQLTGSSGEPGRATRAAARGASGTQLQDSAGD